MQAKRAVDGRILGGVLLLFAAQGILAAAPAKDDYAQGIRIDALSDRPLIEATLPDDVYRVVTRADLGDVRVFNADGVAVPHAFCAAPDAEAPVVTQESLPVFELQGASKMTRDGTSVEIQTSAGTAVKVQEGSAAADTTGATETLAHVIDARNVSDELRAIQFDWQSPDGASEAHVSIEASEDLDRWQRIVSGSTLLQVTRGTQRLQREKIPLPQRRYQYLRVVRTDGGPSLQIAAVIAERVSSPLAIEPLWFTANMVVSTDANVLLFDSARLAPVSYARLRLPQENSSMRVHMESRADENSIWMRRWSGEVYSIVNGGDRRVSPPAEFASTTDRYWRVQPQDSGHSLNQMPALELGYRPARLRFLAQGSGPYVLAYGSRRAEVAPAQQCGALLADVGSKDLEGLIGQAVLAAPQGLGGDSAFKPLPKKTPVRLVVLWSVLIVGVALLVAMALSLLKRLGE